jgi:hypothetical protein
MAFTISPYMNLTIPTVGVEQGPAWATDINADLLAIDSHNHTVGQGALVPITGLLLNSDLPLNDNNLTTARTVRFSPQLSSFTPGVSDVGCLYVAGIDLYYVDGGGSIIPITASHSLDVTSTGIVSGTATASFSGGVFVVNSNVSTPANLQVAAVIMGNPVAGTNYVTLAPPNPIPAPGYTLTLPLPVTGVPFFLTLDSSGNISGTVSTAGGITGTNIATNTISASNIVPGTLTGTQFQSNINLPGSTTTINGAFPVVGTTSIGKSTEVLFGRCDGNSLVINGGVSTFTHPSTGVYTVTLADAFAAGWTPTVTTTVNASADGNLYNVRAIVSGTNQITFYTSYAAVGVNTATPTNLGFSFIAIGAQA